MAKIWRNRIEAETKKFGECPDKYKKEVLKLMRDDVQAGVISPEDFERLTGMPYEEDEGKDA